MMYLAHNLQAHASQIFHYFRVELCYVRLNLHFNKNEIKCITTLQPNA